MATILPNFTMIPLNTRQRDMLRLMLQAGRRIVVQELADELQITPRQVNYGLKGVKAWLRQRGIELLVSPGVGVEVKCTATDRQTLLKELGNSASVDLVLTAGQRRQLISFVLINDEPPLNLVDLQTAAGVSRSTILKDLDEVEEWLERFSLRIDRRPNYGIWIDGSEHNQRQALAALLWGEVPFEEPMWQMSHVKGLDFSLADDAHLLPILNKVLSYCHRLDIAHSMAQVALAEADMGGRFTDDEVLHLALTLSIQFDRIEKERLLDVWPLDETLIEQLMSGLVWKVSEHLILSRLPDIRFDESHSPGWETGLVAAHLLAGPKNARWPGDSEVEKEFDYLVATLLKMVSEAYQMPALNFDTTLRDGLMTNLVPACLRSRFGLWTPPLINQEHLALDRYRFEYEISRNLANEVERQTGIELPEVEIRNLVLLLRAAYIRERPQDLKDVLVVCPSGMATAQLLVARLRARFHRLGNLTVISVRELSDQRVAHVDLIISTVPLDRDDVQADVIQVHPLLLPEDVAAITQWLAK